MGLEFFFLRASWGRRGTTSGTPFCPPIHTPIFPWNLENPASPPLPRTFGPTTEHTNTMGANLPAARAAPSPSSFISGRGPHHPRRTRPSRRGSRTVPRPRFDRAMIQCGDRWRLRHSGNNHRLGVIRRRLRLNPLPGPTCDVGLAFVVAPKPTLYARREGGQSLPRYAGLHRPNEDGRCRYRR